MKAEGVTVCAVTAEPGGEDAVRARLAERGLASLSIKIKSDPTHQLLVKDAGDIFIIAPKEWEVSGNYDMVQPAVVVFDERGAVVKECTWSWKIMGYDNGMTRLPTEAWDLPPRTVPLVNFRPQISDLLPSIKERRAVRLSPALPSLGVKLDEHT